MATNGLNLIGFGTESVTMGGADIAVARDTSAMNTNPAGLTQISDRMVEFYGAVGKTLDAGYRDSLGNDPGADVLVYAMDFGYARHLANRDVTVGFGVFAQGGSGVEYDDLLTAVGTRDEFASDYRVAKVTPSIAYQVDDRLSIGATLALIYAEIEQRIFPETSVFNPVDPRQSLLGYELKDAHDTAPSAKLGVRYEYSPELTLAATYTTKTDLTLESDRFVHNLTGLGLGEVTYRDAELRGLAQPQEIAVGIAFRPRPQLLVSAEVNWINWADALNKVEISAARPDNPFAPASVLIASDMDWRDQYVVSAGFAYEVSPRTILRAGYNYGRNPIPDRNLTPLFATVAEHHVTLGVGRQWTKNWHLDVGAEYDVKKTVDYSNPSLRLGETAQVYSEALILHATLRYEW